MVERKDNSRKNQKERFFTPLEQYLGYVIVLLLFFIGFLWKIDFTSMTELSTKNYQISVTQEKLNDISNQLKQLKKIKIQTVDIIKQKEKLQTNIKRLNLYQTFYGCKEWVKDEKGEVTVYNWGSDYRYMSLGTILEIDLNITGSSPLHIQEDNDRYAYVVPIEVEYLQDGQYSKDEIEGINRNVRWYRQKWGLENISEKGQPMKIKFQVGGYKRNMELWRVENDGVNRLYFVVSGPGPHSIKPKANL